MSTLPCRLVLFLFVLAAALFLLCQPVPAAEEERLVLDSSVLWNYAESLFGDGEYYRAVTEYKRLVHFFPAGPHAQDARLRIGLAYLRGGEPDQAVVHYAGLLETTELQDRNDDLHYLLGLSRLERDRGRPYPLRLEGIEEALADFRAISPQWPDRQRVADFAETIEHPPELPEKSPLLAGSLSAVIPGTGSFYVERYAEGALALFVNAVLIYATVNSLQRDQLAAATVFGVLALAFYGGSIYAAVGGAHKFNDRHRSEYLAGQRKRFGVLVPGGRIGAVFEQRF